MDQQSPHVALRQMLTGFWITECLYVAAYLKIADLVADNPKSVAELAALSDVDAPSLYRVLRALASVGVFAEGDEQAFEQTPVSSLLREGTPDSLRGLVMLAGTLSTRAWSEIVESVRTGRPAFEKVFGMPLFEHLGRNPEVAKIFDEAMAGQTSMLARSIVDAYDFSQYRTIVDVGGGKGALIAEILAASPRSNGINFDRPAAAKAASSFLQARGMAARCQSVGGDFFADVPAGGDVYLLKFVLHDWDDNDCMRILQNVRAAMSSSGTLLVIESVIPPGNTPYAGKFMDINMLVMSGGRERTEVEYRLLFERAGLHVRRIIPAHPLASIIEGAVA